jgi:hypothetical protein
MTSMRHFIFHSSTDLKQFRKPGKDQPILVFVYMKGCFFCDQMTPEWKALQHQSKFHTLMVERQLLPQLQQEHLFLPRIRPHSFPFLYLLPDGSKNEGVEFMSGNRSAKSFESFVSRHVKKSKITQRGKHSQKVPRLTKKIHSTSIASTLKN